MPPAPPRGNGGSSHDAPHDDAPLPLLGSNNITNGHSKRQAEPSSEQHPYDDAILDDSDEFYDTSSRNPFATNSLRGDGYGGGGLYRRLTTSTTNTNNTPSIESHNYEPDESEVWRAHVAQQHFTNRGHWWTTSKKRAMKKWILTCLIGVTQAFVASACNYVCRYLSAYKFDTVLGMMQTSSSSGASSSNANDNYMDDLFQGVTDDRIGDEAGAASAVRAPIFLPFLVFLAIQVGFAAIASMFVWIEPVSAGSGIPEIK